MGDGGRKQERKRGNKRGRGDGGEIKGDRFRNEKCQCKKLNLVLPKESMPTKDIATQLT